MCTRIELNTSPIITEEDITVYKVCYVPSFAKFFNKPIIAAESIYRNFEYLLNVLYQRDIGFSNEEPYSDETERAAWDNKNLNEDKLFITTGFHSFASIERCKRHMMNGMMSIVEFIIPKGSELYKGRSECLVSNQIIFKGKAIPSSKN